MTVRIRVTLKDVDESLPDPAHGTASGMNGTAVRRSIKPHDSLGAITKGAVSATQIEGIRCKKCDGKDSLRVTVTRLPSRSSPKASEGWLGGRDSNPDKRSQSPLSYR